MSVLPNFDVHDQSPYGGSVEEGVFSIPESALRERIAFYANENNLCEEGVLKFCRDIGLRPPGRKATVRLRIDVDVQVLAYDGRIDTEEVAKEFGISMEAHLGRSPLTESMKSGDVEMGDVWTMSVSDAEWLDES